MIDRAAQNFQHEWENEKIGTEAISQTKEIVVKRLNNKSVHHSTYYGKTRRVRRCK